LDRKAVKALPDDELLKWYRIVERLSKRDDIMKEAQFQIKEYLGKELNERGIKLIQ